MVKQFKLTNDLLKKNNKLLTQFVHAEMKKKEEKVNVLVNPFLKSLRDKVLAMKLGNSSHSKFQQYFIHN
jgi:hypothetical protein